MKPRKPNEPDADYIRRLEAANCSLREDNKRLKQWASNLDKAVSILATDASLAFQAMAEKAGVRSHPSVRAVIKMFDSLVGMYWHEPDAPKIEFPKDWDLDPPEAWSGDADMQLNSPIAEAIEALSWYRVEKPKIADKINEVIEGLERVLDRGIEGVKAKAEIKPRERLVLPKHYQEMTRDELLDLVNKWGWILLDIVQDLDFTNELLRRDLRAAAYRRLRDELYMLVYAPIMKKPIGIKVFGNEEAE